MRCAVLVSGSGSNLQALLDAEAQGQLAPAVIDLVISNKKDAYALQRAEKAGVATEVLSHTDFSSRHEYDAALLALLQRKEISAVVLAGFMRVLTDVVLAPYALRVINVHPALCPAFPGMHAARQALAAGVKITGCTVHFVDVGVDTGPIIFQAAVPVLPDDTEAALQARIQVHEHDLLPKAVQHLAAGRLAVVGRQVVVK